MKRKSSKPSRRAGLCWLEARDVKDTTLKLIKSSRISWVDTSRLFFIRSHNSNARAYARIWGLSRVWQDVLKIKAAYVIEVLSERFDKLSNSQKEEVILHELAHIPKNFSGSLVPHYRSGKRKFKDIIGSLKLNKK